jgi:glycosyltransferase involved in cell wall biosynthesis
MSCKKDLDAVFVGACYGPRKELITKLKRYFEVEAYGYGWPRGCVSFEESIRLFSRARVVLGIGGVGPTLAVQTLKGRDFEVPMCGATYLTSANSELADHFVIGQEVVCYSLAEDCVESLARLLADHERCAAIGLAARERCLREHTWDHRLRRLFSLWNI